MNMYESLRLIIFIRRLIFIGTYSRHHNIYFIVLISSEKVFRSSKHFFGYAVTTYTDKLFLGIRNLLLNPTL